MTLKPALLPLVARQNVPTSQRYDSMLALVKSTALKHAQSSHQVYMKPCVLAIRSHGRMAMPTRDAITPPVAKLMCCGARFTRAFATGTTLAAMLVLRVARIRPETRPWPSHACSASFLELVSTPDRLQQDRVASGKTRTHQ